MPPVSRAVIRTTATRKSTGQAMDRVGSGLRFRLSAYCNMERPRLTPVSKIHTGGLPGTRNSTAVLFQAAISRI